MAYELQPFGIKVAIIEPGAIKTNFKRKQSVKGTSKSSPYLGMMQSHSNVSEEMLKHRLSPQEVAKAVIEAIKDPNPKLRYTVGKDAEELIQLKRRSSDEEIFWMMGKSFLKKEEQKFLHNRGQVDAQKHQQIEIKQVNGDGWRGGYLEMNQSDYFLDYQRLKMTRDKKGILVVQFHTNDGPLTFTSQDHTEFVDAFYRI